MHSMRCESCEAEIKGMERVQLLVSDAVKKQVDAIDFSGLWSAIDQRIAGVHVPWMTRARAWWEELRIDFDLRVPVFVTAALVAVLALTWYARQPDISSIVEGQQIANFGNEAAIESLETTFDSVDFINDPESPVVWISNDGPLRETVP
jgi:hypothetical protein